MTEQVVAPPCQLPEIQRGVWCALPDDEPVIDYLHSTLWDHPQPPAKWEVARFSHAVYLYREANTHWSVVAKFYGTKTDATSATRHAKREFESTREAARICLAAGSQKRALRPLAVWRGVLFLEYIDGLTLEDIIAVRRHRPGTLLPSLSLAAELLAALHTNSVQPDCVPEFEEAPAKAAKHIDTLVKYGVLQDDPIIAEGLKCLVDQWADRAIMRAYVPTVVHGDATTTNFVFPWDGGVVGIDWERFNTADPASDLGRLLAEISHSLKQHGGSVKEAIPELDYVLTAYCERLPADWDLDSFLSRVQFFRALSTLRIARNGWVSRLDRTVLVAQALALLANIPGR
jgi:thiamine kinase-like enzyme